MADNDLDNRLQATLHDLLNQTEGPMTLASSIASVLNQAAGRYQHDPDELMEALREAAEARGPVKSLNIVDVNEEIANITGDLAETLDCSLDNPVLYDRVEHSFNKVLSRGNYATVDDLRKFVKDDTLKYMDTVTREAIQREEEVAPTASPASEANEDSVPSMGSGRF